MNLHVFREILVNVFPLIALTTAFLAFGIVLDEFFKKSKAVVWISGILTCISFAGIHFIKPQTYEAFLVKGLYAIPATLLTTICLISFYCAYLFQQKASAPTSTFGEPHTPAKEVLGRKKFEEEHAEEEQVVAG